MDTHNHAVFRLFHRLVLGPLTYSTGYMIAYEVLYPTSFLLKEDKRAGGPDVALR
jgi:hypothetical protein